MSADCIERCLATVRDADIVLVALGAPKQELLIQRLLDADPTGRIYVGIGGAIDYLSGAKTLPPAWVRRVGAEWLYRLVREPRSRVGRQLASLPRFAWGEIVSAVFSGVSMRRADRETRDARG